MSFILDALRRADAQRERQAGGGLHGQAMAPPDDDEAAAPRWRSRPLLLVLLLLAGAALALLLMWPWRAPRPGPALPVAAVAPSVAATVMPPAAAPVVLPAPAQAVVPTIDTQPVPDGRRAPAVQMAQAGVESPGPMGDGGGAGPPTQRRSSRAMPLPGPEEASAGVNPPPTVPSQPPPAITPAPMPMPIAPAAGSAGPRQSALPAGAPQVLVSGGVFSQNAARRMVIVNGQVYGEGAEPVSGVTIEQIQPNRAVLRYQGQRYTVTY